MKVTVYLEVPYVVEVDTPHGQTAKQAVEANWDTVYKHQARPVSDPPHLTARVLCVSTLGDTTPDDDGDNDPRAALQLIDAAYRLAERSTPANLRRAILAARDHGRGKR